MAYKHLKKLTEEYFDVVGAVSNTYGFDMGIAISVMTAAVRNNTTAEVKGVPEDFDWAEFAAKYEQYKAEC